MQKKHAKQTKKVGLGQTPPLVWEKFPRFIVFFLESLPYTISEYLFSQMLADETNGYDY